MTSVFGADPWEGDRQHDAADSDTPTPPTGFPALGEEPTPPSGFSSVVSPEDYGRPSPLVLGGPEPGEERGDAGDWPTLEYRVREGQSRGRDWLGRRRRDSD
jgi:hypothetical protein